ncbi:MAG TPA: 2,3-bisphosphoglycerate-independent phosphoglycerate mutase [Candidatus Limenecus avicola]|uniref:2,3-bisphosphoglycerate-independent phosphoglycerate mutase n=1 Tax=Candidatus Limenecus avicola TaxID=2840847 RepID=A0A9D1SQL2_9CLOT|nr:2 3-bisphosphoglycerate-independent phosphoglycerate mutase [Clostridium sp. CAG:306]HIU91780.1 2,3-bisphosphoglycerate-independent phosphoglycerate mutase [Candidatus Limenecus avicola]
MTDNKRVLLCIMDGWGINKDCPKDATKTAKTPNFDKLKETEKYTQINASGEYVGLPDGQMGNSEVGHLNLGAGRVVYQDLTRINKEIREGKFFENKAFKDAIEHVKKNDSSLHLYGLVSTGGVHSSFEHVKALVKMAAENGLKKVYVHAFLDGRDTPPKSAVEFLAELEAELKKYNLPQIATISGRYWAMDRDNRWDRVEKAYNALLFGEGEKAANSDEAIKASYAKDVTDEFVEPTITNADPDSRIKDNDAIIFFNYRPDRAREITRAMTFEEFDGFNRKARRNNLYYVCMAQYDETFPLPIAYPPEKLTNILGDVLDDNGVKQYRTAETEKYAHITFFFNGGEEKSGKLETRALVASPKVATYDLQPEMSAPQVCENVLKALDDPQYGFILVNFANPDMVGHTGVFDAAIKACETVDTCVGKIVEKAKENGVVMLLTADHGNSECMEDPQTHTPFTAHTTNPVPFMLINGQGKYELKDTGALCDVAPTILQLLGIKQPAEMTGQSLIK